MSIKKREMSRVTFKLMAPQPIEPDTSDTVLGICLLRFDSMVA